MNTLEQATDGGLRTAEQTQEWELQGPLYNTGTTGKCIHTFSTSTGSRYGIIIKFFSIFRVIFLVVLSWKLAVAMQKGNTGRDLPCLGWWLLPALGAAIERLRVPVPKEHYSFASPTRKHSINQADNVYFTLSLLDPGEYSKKLSRVDLMVSFRCCLPPR